jgi:hypothetical protein
MKLTNTSGARQGVRTTKGLVWLKPGEAREDLELTEEQARRADRLPFITVEGEAMSNPNRQGAISQADREALRRQFDQMRARILDLEGRLESAEAGNSDLAEKLRVANAEVETWKALAEAAEKSGNGGGSAEKKTPAEVIAMADDGTPFLTFKAEAGKLLGDDIPAKKAEIVDALKKL